MSDTRLVAGAIDLAEQLITFANLPHPDRIQPSTINLLETAVEGYLSDVKDTPR